MIGKTAREAIDEYKETLSILPGDPECCFNMAQIYAGRLGDAKKGAA